MNRNILNLAMTLGLVAVMDYRFTGNAVHEVLGIVLVLLFLLHNTLNRFWYGAISTGKQNLFRGLVTAVNLLLLLMMLVVTGTGVLISQTVFAAFSLSGHLWVHQLHTFSAYSGFILCGIHLGLHWRAIAGRICRELGLDSTQASIVLTGRVASLFIIGYGIYSSFSHQIGAKLFFEHVFGGWGAKPSLLGFLVDYPAIFGCNTLITHYLVQLLQNRDFAGRN